MNEIWNYNDYHAFSFEMNATIMNTYDIDNQILAAIIDTFSWQLIFVWSLCWYDMLIVWLIWYIDSVIVRILDSMIISE
jgi:hypothetical protein